MGGQILGVYPVVLQSLRWRCRIQHHVLWAACCQCQWGLFAGDGLAGLNGVPFV